MRTRIQEILACMKADTFEREDVLALSLLSALAGESIFLLGLPGVGKSMIARKLKFAFKNATVFEYLMSRFSTPDEIFGPVSISKLKNEDCYERVITGYLPDAEVVFLDEIWKAGPAIQNSLLTVLNEKIYLNGNHELQLPLKGVIAASNELPAKDEGLEALWDRFLIRYIVNPIEKKQNFYQLVVAKDSQNTSVRCTPISHDEYLAIRSESMTVEVPTDMLDILFQIREKLNAKVNSKDLVTDQPDTENQKYYVSDRRWKKAVGVMRVSAYLNGRPSVDLSDVMLLAHMLWSDEESVPVIRQIMTETIVSSIFRGVLDQYKSKKRHATVAKNTNRLYTPDKVHYIIQCDDSPLKIAIKDYNRIRTNPGTVFFGSETADGRLMIRERGQFVIRYVNEGVLCINNYNYHLSTESDAQLSIGFISEVGDSIDNIANRLYMMMNQNLFVVHSDLYQSIKASVAQYREQIKKL